MARKRSTLVPVREPNGRLQRPTAAAIGAVSPAEARRLRDAALRGMRDAEWGTELGRLFLADEIEPSEFEAGKRWGNLVAAYYQAIGAAPPHAKSMAFDRIAPAVAPDMDSEAGQKIAKRDRAVIEDMREADAVLLGAGALARGAVRGICEANESSVHLLGLDNLRRGLQWLARHWQLVHAPKKKTA